MSDRVAEKSLPYQVDAKRSAVPEGYKQTEVGVIPVDWGTPLFGDICMLINGRGFKPFEWCTTGLPIIRIQNLNGSDEFNFFDGRYDSKILIQKDQLLFAWLGSRGTSFGPHVWRGGNALLNYHTWKLVIKYGKVDDGYFFHVLKLLTKKIEDSAHGASALVHTQKGEMELLYVPVPSCKKEQTAIANALSDIDALISEQEKLIAKKQAIKTATMQQLLTGRTRLPQFALREDGTAKGFKQSELGEVPEDWEVVTTGAVCDLLTGFPFPSSKYTDFGVRLLRGSNVKRNRTDWNDAITQFWPEISSDISQYKLEAGDLVIAMDGSLVGRSFAQLDDSDLPAVLLQRVARLRGSSVHQSYLKEWVCSKFFTEHCDSVKTVTAIPHISPADIRGFKFLLPPTNEEQAEIAVVLAGMEEEVAELRSSLDKTHQIKQGMMQELLTGRTRLI